MRKVLVLGCLLSIGAGVGSAVAKPFDEPSVMGLPYTQLVEDPLFGEYEGTYFGGEPGAAVQADAAQAQVVPAGNKVYRVVLRARAGAEEGWPLQAELEGRLEGDVIKVAGQAGANDWDGTIGPDGLKIAKRGYGGMFEMKRVVRTSPNEGLKPPAGALVLAAYAPGKPADLSHFKAGGWVADEDGTVHRVMGTGPRLDIPRQDLLTAREDLRSYKLHVEFRVPYEPALRGQMRGNSGIIMADRYEVQVLDTFGLIPGTGDCASVYAVAPPKVNAAFPPLSWQTYDITFRAPKLGADGTLKRKPQISVVWNGVTVHENQEMDTPTGNAKRENAEQGPLRIQDHGNLVLYRNIWLVELPEEK